jgi:hypothetical protein
LRSHLNSPRTWEEINNMNDKTGQNENKPIMVFTGTAWEVALVQSLLENAEIITYVQYGGEGTLAPLDTIGGIPMNRITVSSDDAEKAKQVVDQYYEVMKE